MSVERPGLERDISRNPASPSTNNQETPVQEVTLPADNPIGIALNNMSEKEKLATVAGLLALKTQMQNAENSNPNPPITYSTSPNHIPSREFLDTHRIEDRILKTVNKLEELLTQNISRRCVTRTAALSGVALTLAACGSDNTTGNEGDPNLFRTILRSLDPNAEPYNPNTGYNSESNIRASNESGSGSWSCLPALVVGGIAWALIARRTRKN
jgi:hypothetical protein